MTSNEATPEMSWWGFSLSTSDEDAVTLFMQRFGYPPRRIIRRGPLKLAGPIHGSVPVETGHPVVIGEIENAG